MEWETEVGVVKGKGVAEVKEKEGIVGRNSV